MHCILCATNTITHLGLCSECENELPFIGPHCQICALPTPISNSICGQCTVKAPLYNKIITPFHYTDSIMPIINMHKFEQRVPIARLLANFLLDEIQKHPLPELIIPVPLHPNRLYERGFNQALEIARPIAKHLKIPLTTQLCTRIKNTPAQHQLDIKKRKRNLKNAFKINDHIDAKHIAIIDDVLTTGSTINAIIKALKKNEIKHVDIWCCARTVLKTSKQH